MKRFLLVLMALCLMLQVCVFAEEDWMASVYIALEDYSDNVIYDVPYCGENSTPSQIMHIVLPAEEYVKGNPMPVLMFVHGGAWTMFNSMDHKVYEAANAALFALERGYAVALPDYTLASETGVLMPNQIYEVKAAVRYLRSIAEEYNFDADCIVAMGESAGGHLVNMLGATNGNTNYDYEAYGNMEFSSEVQAVVSQYSIGNIRNNQEIIGMTYGVDPSALSEEELQAILNEMSPVEHIDGNEPPFYIEAGLADATVHYTQSCDLYNAIMVNNPDSKTELHLYAGCDHGAPFFWGKENADLYLEWLEAVLAE